MSTIVHLDTGQVLGVLDGRTVLVSATCSSTGRSSGASVSKSWQSTRPRPSARHAACSCPRRVSVNLFHLRMLANHMLAEAPAADPGPRSRRKHRHHEYQTRRPGIHQRTQLQNAYPVEKCRPDGGMNTIPRKHFSTNREEPTSQALLRGRPTAPSNSPTLELPALGQQNS
jgi:hypothetical protein